MKIQLALDIPSIGKALNLGMVVQDYVDLIEVGTPLIKTEGEKAIRAMRECFPKKTILADMKTMDGGEYEAELAFEAGADMTVVMGSADDATIESVLRVASRRNKEVMIDLLGIRDLAERIKAFNGLSGEIILLVHTSYDRCQREEANPFKDLEVARKLSHIPLAVGGGISLSMVKKIKEYDLSIVAIGSAISLAKDPSSVAKEFKRIVGGAS